MERMRRLGLELCLLLSGFSALLYETVWTREFAGVFGTSALSVATVLAAYMGGLALGAALTRRLVQRMTRPVLVYGALELSIAVSALLVPVAIRGSTAILVALFGGQPAPPEAGGFATAGFYAISAFAILAFPTVCMGATLPLLVRHDVRTQGEIGSRVGRLYAANTGGAALGAMASAYLLLPELGLRRTVLVGAGVNALVFLGAVLLSRGAAPLAPLPASRSHAPARNERVVLILVLLSGLTTFGYEVLWTRLLSHVLGGSTYAFATMLSSFLLGIALGSAAGGRMAASRRRAVFGFAMAQVGIAALSYAGFAALDLLPGLLAGRGVVSGAASHAAIAVAILLPSTLCIGATFPFAVRALAERPEEAAPTSGRVYAWSTVGSIAGSIGAGFWFIPWLGFAGFLNAAAALNLLVAGATLLLAGPPARRALLAPVAALLALALLPVSPPWRLLRASPLRIEPVEGQVAHFAAGRTASVLLVDHLGEWQLRTNGLPESTIQRRGGRLSRFRTAAWLGALPVMARPELESMLVIGFGGGLAVEAIPGSVRHVDVVEIEPRVVEANRIVGGERAHDPLQDPRVHLSVNDARGALLLTDRRYDAIVSQPSHPWAGAAASLYTREFFELVRSRLEPGGVFVQWIGLAFVDEPLLRSLAATLRAVFPEVRAYAPEGAALLFVASERPVRVEEDVARALVRDPFDLARLGVRAPEDAAAALVLDEKGMRGLADGFPVIDDDRNLLEMRSPRILERSMHRPSGARLLETHAPPSPDCERLDCAYLVRRMLAAGHLRRASRTTREIADRGTRAAALGFAAISRGDRFAARRFLERALVHARSQSVAVAGLVLVRREELTAGDAEALELEQQIEGPHAAVVESWRAEVAGDWSRVRVLDPNLAEVTFRDPLFAAATDLRIRWRLEQGDPVQIGEALRLSEELVAFQEGPDTALLRARTVARAGFTGPAVAELKDLTLRLLARPRSGGDRSIARSVLALWSELPDGDAAFVGSQEHMRKKLEDLPGVLP